MNKDIKNILDKSHTTWLIKDPQVGIGTEKNPIRYEHIKTDDPQRKTKLKAQRDKFGEDARSGKVLCLSDLMCSHGM